MSAFVEKECENTLKSGFEAAITSYNNDNGTSYAPSYRQFWSDDESSEDVEDITFPHIEIGAAPNTPNGYQEPIRSVNVTVTIGTLVIHDRKRQTLAGIYKAIRDAIDSRDFDQDTNELNNVEVTVFDGGDILEDDNGNYVVLNLTMEVCV